MTGPENGGTAVPDREWPGFPFGPDEDGHDRSHGAPAPFDLTDDPFRYCEACGSTHHPNYQGCNGLREPSSKRCLSTLGEVTCHKPDGHLGAHHARSTVLDVRWEVLYAHIRG